MGEVGPQERGGTGEQESQVFQVRGVTRNAPRAGHVREHFHRTGWGCEQMQLCFVCGAVGKWSHLYCTMPTMGTASFISYR